MRVRTRVSSVLLIVSGVVLVAGCSSGSGGSGNNVASVDTKGASAPPTDKQEIYRQFEGCLRDQGISGVKVDDNGVGVNAAGAGQSGGGSDGQSDMTAINKAIDVCNKKIPGMQQLRAQHDEKAVQDARKFAACARKNGIPNMADPEVNNGVPQMKMPDVAPEVWSKVLEKCKNDMSGGVGLVNNGGGQ